MKTKLLILLTFACIKLSLGQTYYPLVDNNFKEWKTFAYQYSTYPPDYNFFTISNFYCDSSIMINSREYKKYIIVSLTHNSYSGWENPSSFTFYLREDSSKKVYRYGEPSCALCQVDSDYEYILYDFSLNVNDTFTSTYCYSCAMGSSFPATYYWKVTNIDSVLIGSSMRKRFFLQEIGYSNTDIWIEGIGDAIHPLILPSAPHIQTYREQLICYSENGNLQFYNPNPAIPIDTSTMAYFSDDCLTPLIIPFSQIINSNIYVNERVLYINLQIGKEYTISLYNILGKCVLTQPVQEKMQIDLKNKGINNELLFYRICNGNLPIKTGKLMNL